MRKYKFNILFFLLVTGLTFSSPCFSQNWEVPQDKKEKKSPFKFSEETVKNGKVLYEKNCMSCHGTPMKGNFINLTPSPKDPATEVFQRQTDGELFYKVTNGRGLMPKFKDILTENERWEIISYIRSFHKLYKQEAVGEKSIEELANLSDVELLLVYLDTSKQMKAIVKSTDGKTPLKGVEVALFAERYFGDLPIDEAKFTDEKGEALFNFPVDLPGDKNGNIKCIAKLTNEDQFDNVKKDSVFAIGIAINPPTLLDERAMWNVRSKSPVWLILSYLLVVLVIWGFIIYILLQLRNLRKMGTLKD